MSLLHRYTSTDGTRASAANGRRFVAVMLATAGWMALPAAAQAQAIDDRFWAEGSLYWPAVNTNVRLDNLTTANPGTEIDFESDLDLADRETLPAFTAGARLGGGWSIIAEYFSVDRSGSATLARDIIVDDVVYPTNATVEGEFSSDVYRLAVGWAFARGENYEVGGALGLHATDFEVAISGQGSVNGTPFQSVARRRDVLAPLPTLGLFGTVEVAPQVTLGARVDFMSLGIDDYDGRLINFQASAVYRIFENVGVGVGYRYVDYRVDVEKTDWVGRVRYRFSGPNVFLQVGFR
ncbi:MAG: hypothetical protein ACXWUX_07235 [Allosphingosinicella sp.]